jgi:hypothetical protein
VAAHTTGPSLEPGRHRLLVYAVVPFVVATVVGLVALWPGGHSSRLVEFGFDTDRVNGRVESAEQGSRGITAPGLDAMCGVYDVRLEDRPDAGQTIVLEIQDSPTSSI